MLQVQVIGRLGRDAEVRESGNSKFISFAVAVDDSYKDNTGQEVKRTEWLDVVANYSGVAPYLKKGTLVFVQGKGKSETYTSKQDNQVYAKIKVRAFSIQLCGSVNTDNGTAAQSAPAPTPKAPPVRSPQSNLPDFGEADNGDLPF